MTENTQPTPRRTVVIFRGKACDLSRTLAEREVWPTDGTIVSRVVDGVIEMRRV